MTNLRNMGTGEVWLHVQRELRGQALGAIRLGATADEEAGIYDLVNQAMSTAYAALKAAEAGLRDPTAALRAAYVQLIAAYRAALEAGFTAAADGIAVLADRVGDAMRSVGGAWADVFHRFIGASPAKMALFAGALLTVGLIGASFVLSGPGGQAALVHLAQRRVML